MKVLTQPIAILMVSAFVGLSASAQYTSDLTYDDDVTRGVYFGSGNDNGAFTINRNEDLGIELGLRGKLRYQAIYNSLGNGTYLFPTGGYPGDEELALWNFEFSIDTDFLDEAGNTSSLEDYYFELMIDKDPSDNVDPINVSLIIAGAETNFVNDSHTEGFLFFTWEVDEYAGAQDSQNFGFDYFNWDFLGQNDLNFDPTAPGSYEISLGAYLWSDLLSFDKDPLAFTKIEILVTDDGQLPPVPEPSTIGMLAIGGIGVLLVIRRKVTRK